MEVERLTAVLEASGLAGFQSVMDIADRAMTSSKRNADALSLASRVATDALQQIRMTAEQAAATAGVSDQMKRKLTEISDTSERARRSIENVTMKAAQAAETDAAGDSIDRKLKDITGNANEARRAIESVKITSISLGSGGAGGGSNGGPGLAGVGRGVLLPAAIGVGTLAAPAAGPAIIGLLAAIPALGAVAAGAIGTLGLAFDGMGKAIGGDKKAFDALMPSQQQFVLTVRSLKGSLDDLKQTAAQATFPELTAALHSALSPGTMGAVTTAVERFGHAIGAAAEQWGKYLGSGEFQQLFGPIMQEGAKGLQTMSGAALSLFDALGVLGRAAGPLLDWITKSIAAGSAWLDVWLKGKDATGQLAGAMTEAQGSLKLVAGLVESLGRVVIALGTALYPVSKVFVKDLTDGLNALAGMISRNQGAIRAIVGGALADFVATLKAVVKGVGFVIDGWATLVGRKNAVVGAIVAIGVALAVLTDTNPLLLLVATVVIVVGEIIRHWSTIKTWFEDFAKFLPGLMASMWDGIQGIFYQAVAGLLLPIKLLVQGFADAFGWVPFLGGKIHHALEGVANDIDWFQKQADTKFSDAGKTAGDAWATSFTAPVENAMANFLASATASLSSLQAGFTTAVNGAWNGTTAGLGTGSVGTSGAGLVSNQDSMSAGRAKMLALAQAAIGTPYAWGGSGPGGFDCSGLVMWAMSNGMNISLPHSTYAQAGMGSLVGTNTLAGATPGDVVFTQYNSKGPDHEGIYVGNGQVISAPHTGAKVGMNPISTFTSGGSYTVRDVTGGATGATGTAGTAGTAGTTASPFGAEPAWTTNAGPTAAQKAAATLAANLKTERDKIAAVTKGISQDLKDNALSPAVAAELQKRADAINKSLQGAGKDALPGIRANLATLKAQLHDGLAQAADDTKLKTTIAAINTDLKNKALSPEIGATLKAQAEKINDQLTSSLLTDPVRKQLEAKAAALKAQLQDGLAQALDDKKVVALGKTLQDDLNNKLITSDQFKSLGTQIGKLNSQLTTTLLDDSTRKQVEQKITDLKARLKLDLTLDDDTKKLKSEVGQLNQAITSDLFPAPLAELARKQAAQIGAKIAEGTQASAAAAKAQLKQLAATIKEGVADATAIQNYQSAIAKFKTGLAQSLNQTLGIPDTYATPQALAAAQQGAQRIMAAISKGMTGAALTQAKNQLKQYQTTIQDALNGMVQMISTSRSTYENAWQRLATAGDSAFDRVTSQTITKMQKDLSAAIAAMQIQVQSAYGSFTFGGDQQQTPTEILLAQMQAAKQAQDDADAITAAQAQLSTDQADPTATPATIAADQKALSDALYQLQVDQLQKQADAERAAADQQLQDAQNNAQDIGDAQIQAYQDQRDLQKTALDDQVQALETAFEQGKIDAKTAFADMTALYSQNGVDVGALSVVIAGQIYDGVSSWTAPIMGLMTDLQAQIAQTQTALGITPTDFGGTTTSSGGSTYFQSGHGPYGGKPLLAKGGVISHRPGGMDVTVGEGAEDEVVAPLSSLKLGSGGTMQVNLTVNALDPGSVDWDSVAVKVRDAFTRMAKSGFSNPWGR